MLDWPSSKNISPQNMLLFCDKYKNMLLSPNAITFFDTEIWVVQGGDVEEKYVLGVRNSHQNAEGRT